MGRKSVLAASSALALMFLLAACQSSAGFSYGGSWVGTINDSVAGRGTMTVSMSQFGSQVKGSWTATYASSAAGGSLTGTVSGTSVVMSLVPSNSSLCPYNAVTNLVGSTLSGNYTAYNCSKTITGTLTITKQ